MTRWTRHKVKKVPDQGSKWKELKECMQNPNNSDKEINERPQLNASGNRVRQLNAAQTIAVKKNKRSENRKLKRQRRKTDSMVCFHCRMPGHGMADCPKMLRDNEQGVGICFKCGSTEHNSRTCTAKVTSGEEFAFAKCFVCGEEGHLSKTCPDNPRGLYPSGGCCKLCSSVDHFQKDCPERRIKDEVSVYRLQSNVIGSSQYVSLDDEIGLYESDDNKESAKPLLKKPKVVTF